MQRQLTWLKHLVINILITDIKFVTYTWKNKAVFFFNVSTDLYFKMIYVRRTEYFVFKDFLYSSDSENVHIIFPVAYIWQTISSNRRFEASTAVAVFCNVTHCRWLQTSQNLLPPSSALHVEPADSSEMFATGYQNTWHHMPEPQETVWLLKTSS